LVIYKDYTEMHGQQNIKLYKQSCNLPMLYFVLHVHVSQARKTGFTRKRDLALYLKE